MGCGGSKSADLGDTNNTTEKEVEMTETPKETVSKNENIKEDSEKADTVNTASEPFKTFKIVILGDERSGKTCIASRFVRDEFIDMYLPTLGPESKTKVLNISGKTVKFQILDTSGNERFRQQTSASLMDADGVIMVFDLSDRTSLNNIGFWHKMVKSQAPRHCGVVLAGNKSDVAQGEVSKDDYQAVEELCGTELVETSAKNNINLEMLFSKIGTKLLN